MNFKNLNIGESPCDLFDNESKEDEMNGKCFAIYKTITDDIFSIEEALEAYQVDKTYFIKYLFKMVDELGDEASILISKFRNSEIDKIL